MDLRHVLARGEFARAVDDLPYEGTKHDALEADPDATLTYRWDGGSERGDRDALPAGTVPDAVVEELSATDPRVALLGASGTTPYRCQRGAVGRVDLRVEELSVRTGPATTYAAVVDVTRGHVPGLATHTTTLLHVPGIGADVDEPVTRYVQEQTIAYPEDEMGRTGLHGGMTATGPAARVPPASTTCTAYSQQAGELPLGAALDAFETRAVRDAVEGFVADIRAVQGKPV